MKKVCLNCKYFMNNCEQIVKNVLSESFLHLPLRPIFRQLPPNFINVRTAYASEIWVQLTKNLLAKSSTKRFREYIRIMFIYEGDCKQAFFFQ